MKTLKLTIKKKWFDMILSGEKTEEYREIKPYYVSRFFLEKDDKKTPKEFDAIEFRNGYSRNSPSATFEFLGIMRGYGNEEWGADPNKLCFIISLGKLLSSSI